MISRIESGVLAVSNRIEHGLRIRIVSGLVLGGIWIAAILLGRAAFSALVGVLIVLAIDELATLLRWRGFPVARWPLMGAGAVVATLAYFSGAQGLLAGLAILALVVLVVQTFRGMRVADSALSFMTVTYIAGLLSFLILLSDLRHGMAGVVVVLAGTWASDMGAYFFGKAYGRTPLAPHISAKKTVEGTIAGAVAPMLVVGLAGAIPWLGLSTGDPTLGMMRGLMIGLAIGLIAPLGDLAESRIKRELNVKDSGNVIPGHGGFLDRLDSVIFVSVVVYYLWMWLAG